MNASAFARTYWLESKFEFLKNLRLPVFSLSTLLFPVMFYLMFGLALGRRFDRSRVAVIAGGARLGLAELAGLVPLLLAGTLPFSAMGLALGAARTRRRP